MGRKIRNRNASIFSRLRAVAALLVINFVLMFLFLSISRLYNTYRGYEQSTSQTAALYCATAAGYLENLHDVSKYPGVISNTMVSQTFIALALEEKHIQSNLPFCQEYYKFCKSTMIQYPFIDSIAIYELDGSAVYVTKEKANYYITKSPADAAWMKQAVDAKGAAAIIAPAMREEAGLPMLFDDGVVVTRAVFNPIKLQASGVFVLSIPADTFARQFEALSAFPEQQYALYHNDTLLAGGFDGQTFAGDEADGQQRALITRLRLQNGAFFLYSTYRFDSQTLLVIRTPLSVIMSAIFKINIIILILLGAALFLIVLVIRSMINGVMHPLQRMISVLDSTTDTHFPTIALDNQPRELKPLFTAYNRMSARIELLVNEGLRKDIARQEIELQFLRTQINPHYLYNSLECIHMKAYSNRDYEVARMAELLGSNLQYGLRDTNSKVPLHRECEKAEEYIDLITFHYNGRIQFVRRVDESIMDCLVIKMLLQPLIENAIQHGLTADRPLTIELLGYPTDNRTICLQVSDDGNGIAEDRLEELHRLIEDETANGVIGLRNVHRRLKLNYGDQFGVNIRSILHKSTVVSIQIPLEYAKEGNHAVSSSAR